MNYSFARDKRLATAMMVGTGAAIVGVYFSGLSSKATEQPKAMYGNKGPEPEGPPEAADPHMTSMDVRKAVQGRGPVQSRPLQGTQGPR